MQRQPTVSTFFSTAFPCGLFALFALGLIGDAATTAAEPSAKWTTGTEFRQRMTAPAGIEWKENPLRDGLRRLASAHQTAILLDRRIDPDQRVNLTAKDNPYQALLQRLAGSAGVQSTSLACVIYFGPKETASYLATVAAIRRQKIGKLSPTVKAKWLKQQNLEWPELTSPKNVLELLAEQNHFRWTNLDDVPHDLWPANGLPAMPLADRISLLLAGFGLSYEVAADGSAATLVPFPASAIYEDLYAARGDAAKLCDDLQRQFPEAIIERRGAKLLVRGRYEDHEAIARLLSGEKVRTFEPGAVEKRYTLAVKDQSAGAVAATIAKDLGKALKFDSKAGERLKQPVNFSVREVTLDELLSSTLKPINLQWNLTDEALQISVAE